MLYLASPKLPVSEPRTQKDKYTLKFESSANVKCKVYFCVEIYWFITFSKLALCDVLSNQFFCYVHVRTKNDSKKVATFRNCPCDLVALPRAMFVKFPSPDKTLGLGSV